LLLTVEEGGVIARVIGVFPPPQLATHTVPAVSIINKIGSVFFTCDKLTQAPDFSKAQLRSRCRKKKKEPQRKLQPFNSWGCRIREDPRKSVANGSKP
jgi:hypothetical protein